MQKEEIVQKFIQFPSYLNKKSNTFLANQFNVSEEMIQEIRKELKGDSSRTIVSSAGLDPDLFTVEQIWKGKKGDSIQFKPVKQQQEFIDYGEKFADFIKDFTPLNIPRFANSFKSDDKRDLYMVMCLFDAHLGRQVSRTYVGKEVDTEDTLLEFSQSFYKLLEDTPLYRVKEIILPIGNDFFNVDNLQLQTTRGTPQQNTSNLHDVFQSGLSLLVNMTLNLVKYAPVKLVLVPGNHDRLSSTYLAVALKQIFINSPNVIVDSSPIERKYLKLGKTLLGLAHGELKMEDYAALLPFEGKEHFGSCDFYEYLLGDKHHEKSIQREIEGVVVRHVSALTKRDQWSYSEGYTLSTRRTYSIFYHERDGRYLERIHQMV